jgi:hypothetical protein
MTSAGMVTAQYNNGGEARTAGYMPVFGQEKPRTGVSAGDTAAPAKPAGAEKHSAFYDVLKGVFDIVNPLQHIPVVSALYRHLTGDEPAPIARLAGDGLYGGAFGAAVGFADIALKKITGKDIGERAFAMIDTGPHNKSAPVMVAQNTTNTKNSSASTASAGIVWDGPDATSPTVAPAPAAKDGIARMVDSAPLLQHSAPGGTAVAPRPSGPFAAPQYSSTALPSGPFAAAKTPGVFTSKQKPLLAAASAQKFFETNESRGATTAAVAPQQASRAQVAARMMEALDKYGAMKQGGLVPSLASESAPVTRQIDEIY